MGGERGSKGEGRSARDNSADFTVFHHGVPCPPLLTSKLQERRCARAQSAPRPPVGEGIDSARGPHPSENDISEINFAVNKRRLWVTQCWDSSIHQGERQLLQRCLQKLGRFPKVSHWFCSSVGCLWADGCGFRNRVGAPGFGKTCLLSSEQCRESDVCWQLPQSVTILSPPCSPRWD